jgi:hypothetical protein
MKLSTVLVLLSCITLFAAPKELPVTLLVDTTDIHVLKPSSAFELRFAEPMVADHAVGKADAEPPLIIKPAMTGKWRWVSTQSGVFQPSTPPPLGATYQVTLASGLKMADGKTFRGALNQTYSTPAFHVKGMNMLDYFDAKDAPAQPKAMLIFNADVDPTALAAHLKFMDADRHSVDALVRRATTEEGSFPAYRSDDRSVLTWEAQVREHLAGGPAKKASPSEDEEDDNAPQSPKAEPVLKNQIVVSPAKPLAPGKNWQLTVGQGAPSEDGAFKLAAAYVIPIGDVKPFMLDSAAPENLAVSGKRATLTFSKKLG